MTKEQTVFGRLFFGNPTRAGREEKVLRYIIHRMNRDATLHEVLEDPYVRRNCSPLEMDEVCCNPDLVHACRLHLAEVFESGELDAVHGNKNSES
jgi:hypothetical protein